MCNKDGDNECLKVMVETSRESAESPTQTQVNTNRGHFPLTVFSPSQRTLSIGSFIRPSQRTLSIGSFIRPSQRGHCPFAATPVCHRVDVVHWQPLPSITKRTLSICCHSCPSQRGRCPLAATPVRHREDDVHWQLLQSVTERTLSIGCPSCPSERTLSIGSSSSPSQRLADLFCQPLSESDSATGGNPASCSYGL